MSPEPEGRLIILDFIIWAVADIGAIVIGLGAWVAIWSIIPSGMTP